MFKINLVPEVKLEQEKINKLNREVTAISMIVAAIIAVGILILVSSYAFQKTRISGLNRDIANIENELISYNEILNTVNSLEEGINDIKKVQDSSEDWSLFFDSLEGATPFDTRFVSLNVSNSVIDATLEGSSVESIDRFISSFTNYKTKNNQNPFGNVVVTGYSKNDKNRYSFMAKFTYVSPDVN